LELINFLCHSNFAINFHPFINIVSGANGSGKSAIEAAISMVLGVTARKTNRGQSVKDVIQYNKDWATIRITLHNTGIEALPDYGPFIVIERKLSNKGAHGASVFKITDSTGRTIGKNATFVNELCDKLNIYVDNPCVILKQQEAKEFLSTTKGNKKFELFMKSSKLWGFQESLQEAKQNVNDSLRKQKDTNNSFNIVQEQYKRAKNEYDELKKNRKL